jgi:hypothetical protein
VSQSVIGGPRVSRVAQRESCLVVPREETKSRGPWMAMIKAQKGVRVFFLFQRREGSRVVGMARWIHGRRARRVTGRISQAKVAGRTGWICGAKAAGVTG